MKNITGLLAILIMVLFMSMPGRVSAQEEAQGDKWHFGADIYLWMAAIGGDTPTGGDVDIDFDTLIDNLDMAFMGGFQARKSKWSYTIDAIYLDVKADNSGTITVPIGPGGIDIQTSSSIELKGWVVTPTVGYRVVETEKTELDIFLGARYLWLEAELGLSVVEPPFSETVDESGDIWDGIVGVRGKFNLSKNWYIPFHLDVGGGNSNLTWQAMAGLAYSFKKVDIVATYRYLDWDFDDNKVFDNMNFSGPLVGMKFAW